MKTLRYEAGNVQRLHRKTMRQHHCVWVILAQLQCSKRQSAALLGPEYLALRDASAPLRLGYFSAASMFQTPKRSFAGARISGPARCVSTTAFGLF